MNKTLMLTLENLKKIEPIVIGWNIAQWGTHKLIITLSVKSEKFM